MMRLQGTAVEVLTSSSFFLSKITLVILICQITYYFSFIV